MLSDRVALALAVEARDELDKLIPVLLDARAKLRDWSGAGMPSGNGESSIGTDRHSDPVFSAIRAAEIRNAQGDRVGWRTTDPCRDQLVTQDHELQRMRDTLRRFTNEMRAILTVPANVDLATEGCILCDVVRRPVDSVTGAAQHQCDPDCAKAGHRHPNAHQEVYSRRAPLGIPDDVELEDRARCSWHYKFAERHHVDAPSSLSLWHLDHPGRRVPETLLRELGIATPTERTPA